MKKLLQFSLCLILLLLVSFVANAQSDDITNILKDLEVKMGDVKTMQTDFIQIKKLKVFDQDLLLKGKVFLEKPNLFAWHVESPLKYSMVIKKNLILQWDEDTNRVQKIALSKNPVLQIVTAQMKKWFSGQYLSMMKQYDISAISDSPVSLKFVPLDTNAASKLVASVVVEFNEDNRYIQSITINEKTGDKTIMTFINTRLNNPIDPSSWEVNPSV